MPGDTDAVTEGIQTRPLAVPVDETLPPDETEEEPKELARSIVSDMQSFYVDVDGRRTRITHLVFKSVFGLTVLVGMAHFLAECTFRELTGGVIVEYLFAVPMIGLALGFMSLLVTSAFFPINPEDDMSVEEVIGQRREERKQRKRKRRRKASRHYKADDGSSSTV